MRIILEVSAAESRRFHQYRLHMVSQAVSEQSERYRPIGSVDGEAECSLESVPSYAPSGANHAKICALELHDVFGDHTLWWRREQDHRIVVSERSGGVALAHQDNRQGR